MKRFLLACMMCAALAACALVVQADTIGYTGSASLSTTNWTKSISLQKFDTSLGQLTSIQFFLTGHVEGEAKFESLDPTPTTVTLDLQARLTLKRPDNSELVVAIPVSSTSDGVTAFDGVEDFAGTSGKTYGSLSADKTESATSVLASDFVLFSGLGTIALPITAAGQSMGSGSGNLITEFSTLASADVRVVYTYTPVPEPSSIIGILMGVGGMLGSAGSLFRKRS